MSGFLLGFKRDRDPCRFSSERQLDHSSGSFAFSLPMPLLLLRVFFLARLACLPDPSPGSTLPPAGLSWSSTSCNRWRAATAAGSDAVAATRFSSNGAPRMSKSSAASFSFQSRSRSYQCRPSSTKIQSRGQQPFCPRSCGASSCRQSSSQLSALLPLFRRA